MQNQNFTLITGASSGIGKEIAFECAAHHQNLLLVALPNTGLRSVVNEISSLYDVKIKMIELDLTAGDSVQFILNFILQENICLKYLINNAGIGYASPFQKVDFSLVSTLIKLNVHAVVELTHKLLPELKKSAGAGILNVCSMASWFPVPNKSIYAASKSFLMSFSKSLHHELKSDKIYVGCLCPGATPTSDSVKQRMKEGGKLHYLFACPVKTVARKAVKGMINNNQLIIPNPADQLVLLISRFIPLKIKIAMAGKILGFK